MGTKNGWVCVYSWNVRMNKETSLLFPIQHLPSIIPDPFKWFISFKHDEWYGTACESSKYWTKTKRVRVKRRKQRRHGTDRYKWYSGRSKHSFPVVVVFFFDRRRRWENLNGKAYCWFCFSCYRSMGIYNISTRRVYIDAWCPSIFLLLEQVWTLSPPFFATMHWHK